MKSIPEKYKKHKFFPLFEEQAEEPEISNIHIYQDHLTDSELTEIEKIDMQNTCHGIHNNKHIFPEIISDVNSNPQTFPNNKKEEALSVPMEQTMHYIIYKLGYTPFGLKRCPDSLVKTNNSIQGTDTKTIKDDDEELIKQQVQVGFNQTYYHNKNNKIGKKEREWKPQLPPYAKDPKSGRILPVTTIFVQFPWNCKEMIFACKEIIVNMVPNGQLVKIHGNKCFANWKGDNSARFDMRQVIDKEPWRKEVIYL